jgi:hypothetical protein
VAKVLWAILGVIFLLAAFGFFVGGALAPPEWEQVRTGMGPSYFVNMFDTFYAVSGVCLAIGVFGVWKASHRAGLSPWRRTVRPALLAGFFGLMVAGFVWSRFFAAGEMQLPGLAAVGIGAVMFLVIWLLRGPGLPVLPVDAYWARVWGFLFACVAFACVVGMVATLRVWSEQGAQVLAHDRGAFNTVTLERRQYSYQTAGKAVSETFEAKVPAPSYSLTPVATGLLGVLLIGSVSESRYRRRLADMARRESAGNGEGEE